MPDRLSKDVEQQFDVRARYVEIKRKPEYPKKTSRRKDENHRGSFFRFSGERRQAQGERGAFVMRDGRGAPSFARDVLCVNGILKIYLPHQLPFTRAVFTLLVKRKKNIVEAFRLFIPIRFNCSRFPTHYISSRVCCCCFTMIVLIKITVIFVVSNFFL